MLLFFKYLYDIDDKDYPKYYSIITYIREKLKTEKVNDRTNVSVFESIIKAKSLS